MRRPPVLVEAMASLVAVLLSLLVILQQFGAIVLTGTGVVAAAALGAGLAWVAVVVVVRRSRRGARS